LNQSIISLRSSPRAGCSHPNAITNGAVRNKSSSTSSSPLQGDAGNIATHMHHKMTTFLSVATPLYFLAPESIIPSDGSSLFNSIIGTVIAINISAHSWIGMNYVVTDYVPKINKAMVGPARIFTAAISGITLLGLAKLAINDKGGIKGAILALWNKRGVGDDGIVDVGDDVIVGDEKKE